MDRKITSKIVTILFLDLANYTKTTAELTREKFNELHDHFDNLVLPIVESYQGNVIKKIGDAFLVTFESANESINCSLALQNAFENYRKNNPQGPPLHIRCALHTGEVLLRKGDVYGDAVNTTARIEGVAEKDHIIISSQTYHAINQNEFKTRSIGKHSLKGLKAPLELYQVLTVKQFKSYREFLRKKARRKLFCKIKQIILKIVTLVIIGILIYYFWKMIF